MVEVIKQVDLDEPAAKQTALESQYCWNSISCEAITHPPQQPASLLQTSPLQTAGVVVVALDVVVVEDSTLVVELVDTGNPSEQSTS